MEHGMVPVPMSLRYVAFVGNQVVSFVEYYKRYASCKNPPELKYEIAFGSFFFFFEWKRIHSTLPLHFPRSSISFALLHAWILFLVSNGYSRKMIYAKCSTSSAASLCCRQLC